MTQIDAQRQVGEFFLKARRYVEAPGVTSGLELDGLAARLRHVALVDLQDAALGRSFEDALGAVRYQDTERLRGLLEEMAERLARHGIDPG